MWDDLRRQKASSGCDSLINPACTDNLSGDSHPPLAKLYALWPRSATVPQASHGTQPEPRMNLFGVKWRLQKNPAANIKPFGNTFHFIQLNQTIRCV